MFRRRPRHFRGRRRAQSASSEEESGPGVEGEGRRQGPASPDHCPPRLPEAPTASARGQEAAENGGEGGVRQARGCGDLLSFDSDEKREGSEESFQVKKPSLSAIRFNIPKKESASSAEQTESRKEIFHSESRATEIKDASESDEEDEQCSSAKEDDCNSSTASEPLSSSPQKREDLPPGTFPSAAYIQAARRKRQLARTREDYISLDTSDGHQVSQRKESSDLESEEESDHERKLSFTPKTKSLRQRMAEHIVSESGVSSGDEETQDEWEEQQMKKALKLSQGINEDAFLHKSRTMKITFDPSVSLPPVDLEIVKKRLTTRVTSLQDIHRAHQREYEKYMHDIESSKTTIQELEKSSDVGQNYKFYRAMKTFVENLIDCLNEKLLQINELESAMHTLLQQPAEMLLKRRQDDLRNESAYIQQLSSKNSKSTKDRLGVDEKTQQETQVKDCEARRRLRRQARGSSGKSDHHEGMSSDDELSPGEMMDFQENKDNILQESKGIFEDVQVDFCSIRNILLKFQQWREKFPDSYYDAYISLCLPKLLNPLIRLQLINWNPVEENFTDLEKMPWFRDVAEFSDAKDVSESRRENDPDQTVLPAIIEKTILPKITGFIAHIWDPLSTSQTENLVQLCKKIFEDYSLSRKESSKTKQDLMNSVVSRMKKSIEEDVFIPVYPKSTVEDRLSPHSKFQERQFWSAVKLLRNILLWDGIVPEETLHELGLSKLLNRYLLLILLNAPSGPDNIEKCNKVVACFPGRWFQDLKSDSTLPQLVNFSQHLLQSARTLYRSNCSDETRDVILLLVKINALRLVEDFIEEYKLEHLKSMIGK
ncbi:PREDICTED: GC-rich sequence DNA-binding factor 2 isoform X1 [Crocodylus porosus]|uniref:GC-rich sequence DNA-binding factor 2 isoform X1 n=1 Tax=Crocodylus porosus TaxID=8502 RepID=UPI00093E5E92|nr:PREDICTED: GC-rich sequence DNA-binding factor 2 isoform X1 [Crocodylus porosus]